MSSCCTYVACIGCVLCVLTHSTTAYQQPVSLQGIARHLKQSFANESASNVTATYFNRSILHDCIDRQHKTTTKMALKRECPCHHWRYLLKGPISATPPPSPAKAKRKRRTKKEQQPTCRSENIPFGF